MKNLAALVLLVLASSLSKAQTNPIAFVNQPLVPDRAVVGTGSFALKVSGTGFVSGAQVLWNNQALPTKYISGSELEAGVSASDVSKAGTASITVRNPGTQSSNTVFFPVRQPSSSISMQLDPNFSDFGPLAVGDFNGDGNLDIAVGKFGGTGVCVCIRVYLGNGDGTFQEPITTEWTGTFDTPFSMIAADFNGDGKLDLLVSDGSSPFGGGDLNYVFLGNGDGTFNPLPAFGGPGNGNFMAAADFNKDGKLDLYLGGILETGPFFEILTGNGDGTFNLVQTVDTLYTAKAPAIGDFNGDGNLDLAVADYDAAGKKNVVGVFLGNGDGTFQKVVYYGVPYFNGDATAADLNGDGNLDIATDGVNVLLGKGDGTFRQGTATDIVDTYGGTEAGIWFGDFTGNGHLDLVLDPVSLSSETQRVLVLGGTGTGTFLPNPFKLEVGYDPGGGFGFAIGDFNNDGRLDIVVMNPNPNASGGATDNLYLQSP
jgi:hypothetical protein